VRALAVTPDSKVLISASDDATIRFWDLSNGRCFRTLKAHTGGIRGITLSPDGMKLASASWDRTVKLWAGGAEAAE
jgi:WD40 repeat protein